MAGIHFWPNGTTTIPLVSGEFGPRRSPGGIGSTNHQGIDFQRSIGWNRSSADGVVTYAGYAGGFGNLVIVLHDDGTETKYAHGAPGSFLTTTGQRVKRGDILTTTGTTGNSTGVHLHFETRERPGSAAVNPRNFMAVRLASSSTAGGGQTPIPSPSNPAPPTAASTGDSEMIHYLCVISPAKSGKIVPNQRFVQGADGVLRALSDGEWGAIAYNYPNVRPAQWTGEMIAALARKVGLREYTPDRSIVGGVGALTGKIIKNL